MIFWLKNNWRDKYNDSQLSVEERKLAQQRTKKLIADTKISEAKAKALAEGGNAGISKIMFVDDLGTMRVTQVTNSLKEIVGGGYNAYWHDKHFYGLSKVHVPAKRVRQRRLT